MFTYLHAAFHMPNTKVYRWVQGIIWILILASIALLVVDFLLPADAAMRNPVQTVDLAILWIFAVEIVLRVGSYHPPALEIFDHSRAQALRVHLFARLRYLLRPLMLVDLMAVLALFPGLRGLRALRLLRLFRTTSLFRYRNPVAIVWRAFEESSLLFNLAFIVLFTIAIVGGISFFLVEAEANASVTSILDGVWWALVTITTVGYGDITPVTYLGRIIGGILMISGMVTLALFAGIVGSILVKDILSIREEQFRMSDYSNHIIVCGYDQSTHLLLEALDREFDLGQRKIVLFDKHERPRDLPPDFTWVQGDFTKESELDKVRLTHAATVIISGERDTTPQIADARTILTIFTVRSYLLKHSQEIQKRRTRLYVLAEILDSENVDHAKTSGADEVIETRRIGYSMMAHAAGYHGIATVMSGMLLQGDHSVYIGKISDKIDESMTFGQLMIDLQLSHRGGLVVGVRTPSGEEIFNPEKSFPIRSDMHLLYLAKEPLLEPPQ